NELPPGHSLLAFRSRWDTMTSEDVAHRLVTHRVSEIGQGTHDTIYPHEQFSRAIRTTRSSIPLSIRGRPTALGDRELSLCGSAHVRRQARMVSGLATVAISARVFLPNCWPISASAVRSLSVSCTRPVIC